MACFSTSTLPYDQAAANSSSLSPPEEKNLRAQQSYHCSSRHRGKGAVPMGGAINRSFMSAHFLLSTYFLTVQTYKRIRLITQVYGTVIGQLDCALPSNQAMSNVHLTAKSD